MTKNEFMKEYGNTNVKFNDFYNGIFRFSGRTDSGLDVEVGVQGIKVEGGKIFVDIGGVHLVRELNPYMGDVYKGGILIDGFIDDIAEKQCSKNENQVVVSCGSEQAAKALADFDFNSLADIMLSTPYGENFGYDVDDDFYRVKDNLIDRAYRVVSEVVENPDSCISTGGFSAFINEAGILELSFTLAHSVG